MLRKITVLLLVVASVFMIASCASTKNAADDAALSTGKPWIDSQVDGGIKPDMQFDVKDDFAAATNKEWVLNKQIPTGYSACGGLFDVMIQVSDQLFDLVTGPNKNNDPDLAKVQTLYNLFMDWDARNKAGIAPIKPVLNKLDAINTIADINSFILNDVPNTIQVTLPFGWGVGLDINDSTRYTVDISSTPLLLGDSAEYSNLTEYGKMLKDAYLELSGKLLMKVGYSKDRTEEIINNTLAFETAISSSMYTANEQGSPDILSKINNPVTRAQLSQMEGKLPIVATVLANGVDAKDFTDANIADPKWLEALNNLYVDSNAAQIRDYMILHYVLNNANFLDRESYDLNMEILNALSGIEEPLPVEKNAADFAASLLGWSLAKAYCNLYFTEADKARINDLCSQLLNEYKSMIQEEDFLSEATRAYAIEKVEAMVVHSLYPNDDEWPDYSKLIFNDAAHGGSLYDALSSIIKYENKKGVAKLGTTPDRTVWNEGIMPTTMNAFNYPQENAIYILAAICQNNVYNSDMTTEELFAGIGSTIGHEISHSFDSSGAQFDKTGNLANWWTEEDYKVFLAKNKKMSDWYSTISPWEGQYVHGDIITGEAGADMAGIKVILRLASKIPGFDYDKFFRSYSKVWQAKGTMQNDLSRIMTDNHPLNYLRINATLAQFDKFQETYGIKPGDGMYIAPEDRVIIW